MKIFKPLTLSLVLSAMFNSANAQDFSQTIFFGDSLTDSGAYGAKFTTNPDLIWSEQLAQLYATSAQPFTQGGTNYAMGGALSENTSLTSPALPVSTQINNYLTNYSVDTNALYSVWIGANDLMAAAENSATAPQTIIAAAQGTVTSVEKLNQAGANYILVPNLPDVGLAPGFINKPLQTAATQGAMLYNMALYNALNQSSANVIPANTFKLLQEVIQNPNSFGFKNVNDVACTTPSSLDCTQNTLVENGANTSYAFADSIHPTARTHLILAQYYRSIIEAPSQIAALSNTILAQGNTQ